jgi:hypothetical protein
MLSNVKNRPVSSFNFWAEEDESSVNFFNLPAQEWRACHCASEQQVQAGAHQRLHLLRRGQQGADERANGALPRAANEPGHAGSPAPLAVSAESRTACELPTDVR